MTTTEAPEDQGRADPDVGRSEPVTEARTPAEALPSDSTPEAETRAVVAPTKRDRRKDRLRTARAWIVIVVVVVAGIALGVRQINERLARRDHVPLSSVALTAEPVDVVSTNAASVVEILVEPRQEVEAGDEVATIDAIRPAPTGGEQRVRQTLVAPIDGIVASVPTNAGAAVQPGGVLVRIYDPQDLHFLADLDLETTTKLEVGMTGEIDSAVTGPIEVSVASIEPSLGSSPGDDRDAVVKLRPTDPKDVTELLPGLVFGGYVDERTAK